ncbi:hypothetical protein GCM10010169_28140 [Micromonospora fulviviridis]|nr:hypothetical protein GCM10010169_28140 [Micromonospora fulviviridis]
MATRVPAHTTPDTFKSILRQTHSVGHTVRRVMGRGASTLTLVTVGGLFRHRPGNGSLTDGAGSCDRGAGALPC